MDEIKNLQEQLREQQKLASLGMLSAGIAHEIQNPLNFVINFSKLSTRLIKELQEVIDDVKDSMDPDDAEDILAIAEDLNTNMEKIQEHGERAISIIQGILLISRGKAGEKLPTDIPKLLHEYAWLSYHARRANDKSFNISINEVYPDSMPKVMVIPQDLSRAIVNIMNNACYAVHERQKKEGDAYAPTTTITVTWEEKDAAPKEGLLTIAIADNGTGMPSEVKEALFHKIITTKPIGEGTGLGMQITHDIIVKNHGGEISLDSTEGVGTTFTITIPCEKA